MEPLIISGIVAGVVVIAARVIQRRAKRHRDRERALAALRRVRLDVDRTDRVLVMRGDKGPPTRPAA